MSEEEIRDVDPMLFYTLFKLRSVGLNRNYANDYLFTIKNKLHKRNGESRKHYRLRLRNSRAEQLESSGIYVEYNGNVFGKSNTSFFRRVVGYIRGNRSNKAIGAVNNFKVNFPKIFPKNKTEKKLEPANYEKKQIKLFGNLKNKKPSINRRTLTRGIILGAATIATIGSFYIGNKSTANTKVDNTPKVETVSNEKNNTFESIGDISSIIQNSDSKLTLDLSTPYEITQVYK